VYLLPIQICCGILHLWTGIVIATAKDTELGSVFELMEETVNPRSPLQLKMDELGQQLSAVSIAIIVVIGLIGALQGRPFVEMFQVRFHILIVKKRVNLLHTTA
jgi:Ca2+-transporting ATPase